MAQATFKQEQFASGVSASLGSLLHSHGHEVPGQGGAVETVFPHPQFAAGAQRGERACGGAHAGQWLGQRSFTSGSCPSSGPREWDLRQSHHCPELRHFPASLTLSCGHVTDLTWMETDFDVGKGPEGACPPYSPSFLLLPGRRRHGRSFGRHRGLQGDLGNKNCVPEPQSRSSQIPATVTPLAVQALATAKHPKYERELSFHLD